MTPRDLEVITRRRPTEDGPRDRTRTTAAKHRAITRKQQRRDKRQEA